MKDDPIASTEYIAIRDALLLFRYCDGRQVDPLERNLIGELLQLAEKYNSNGHYIVMELEKMLFQVQRMPKTAPGQPAWFLATIESRLQRRTHATLVNLPATRSPEVSRYLAPLMEHTDMRSAPEERRARQFEREAGGDRFQAFQDCVAGCKGSEALESQVLMTVALWMVREGWSQEFPRKAPVVEFGQQTEGKKRA